MQTIKDTLATQAIENIVPSKEAIKLCEQMTQKNIKANEAVNEIKKKYGVSVRN